MTEEPPPGTPPDATTGSTSPAPSAEEPAGVPVPDAPALRATDDRPLVRAGLRGFLDLTRVDVALVIGLTLLAFLLRWGSPILPNFLGGNATSVPAIQILGAGKGLRQPARCDQRARRA